MPYERQATTRYSPEEASHLMIVQCFQAPPGSRPIMTQEHYAAAYVGGYNRTKRFMISRGASSDSAAEIAQTAWARGWEHRDQIRDIGKVGSWVNTIALNLLRSSFRQPLTCELLAHEAVSEPTPSETIDCDRILSQCSSADRALLLGSYVVGYTSGELGRLLGCSAVAVRVRLVRLRRRLQEALAGGRTLSAD